MADSVKMINSALDEYGSDIILRGVVDAASLSTLKVDTYQREILPMSRIRDLAKAIKEEGVPDIVLGMRGGNYLTRGDAIYLQDDVYLIDGLQRRTAALEVLKSGLIPRLGATVHFNTDFKSEAAMFRKLNVMGVRLSPNVLLRNERDSNVAVEMLYRLCNDSTFILHNRVCWSQRMKREHLIGGLGLLKVTTWMHPRFARGMGGRKGDSNYASIAQRFEGIMERIGRNVVRENTKRFWEVVDESFNVRSVVYSAQAPHLKKGFLLMLAKLFSDHTDFWADANFICAKEIRQKLASFPIHDPHIASLCGSSGASMRIMYEMLVRHINSGKRSRRLTPFDAVSTGVEEIEEEEVA